MDFYAQSTMTVASGRTAWTKQFLKTVERSLCIKSELRSCVWKSRWTPWAPVPNKPTVSVDVKQHFNHQRSLCQIAQWWDSVGSAAYGGESVASGGDSAALGIGRFRRGLLTPLTSAWHRLSPLAAFTSGAYFLHNGRLWQWICEFYTANFKDIFGGP